MKSVASRVWAVLVLAGVVALSPLAKAAQITIDLTSLRAIQTYDLEKKGDQAYLLVTGVAAGKEFSERIPKDKPWSVGPKTPVASVKEPTPLWKGDLAEGEFALITVTLIQGKAENEAKIKEYLDKKAEAEKAVADRTKAKLATVAEMNKLAADALAADQKFVKDVKKILSREQNTDHFGGLFNLIIWNHEGRFKKRLDPVGLTFGEHYGIDPKMYSKLKNTRANVMIKDDTGEWSEQQLTPLSDDQELVRVKMLENEVVKKPGAAEPVKNTIDYVAEIRLKADGKALKWDLDGMQSGPTDIHTYWDFAQ